MQSELVTLIMMYNAIGDDRGFILNQTKNNDALLLERNKLIDFQSTTSMSIDQLWVQEAFHSSKRKKKNILKRKSGNSLNKTDSFVIVSFL